MPESDERDYTGFLKDDEGIYILDYVIRGFLKASARVMNLKVQGKRSTEVSLGSSVIDGYVFVEPRKLRFWRLPEGADTPAVVREPEGVVERPLRGMTMQGPRVLMMRSDMVGSGAYLDVTLTILQSKVGREQLEELLDYGKFSGLGQFRNGSYGRFTWQRLEDAPSR